jgi:hypothetical protein
MVLKLKKRYISITSSFLDLEVVAANSECRVILKPILCVRDYNCAMGGVDFKDEVL